MVDFGTTRALGLVTKHQGWLGLGVGKVAFENRTVGWLVVVVVGQASVALCPEVVELEPFVVLYIVADVVEIVVVDVAVVEALKMPTLMLGRQVVVAVGIVEARIFEHPTPLMID
jgi:hypothetical protein